MLHRVPTFPPPSPHHCSQIARFLFKLDYAQRSGCRTRRRRWPPWCAAQLWLKDEDACLPSRRQARLPWIGVDDTSDVQRLHAEHTVKLQETTHLPVGWSWKIHRSRRPAARVAKTWRPWRTCGTWMTATLCAFLQKFEVANAEVGAERNPQKTAVIYDVDDLGAENR